MDQETGRDFDFHRVRRVAEVQAEAANELLDAGWVLHDIFFTNEGAEYRSNYIMLALTEPTCPRCGALARIEIGEQGDRIRYICTKECG